MTTGKTIALTRQTFVGKTNYTPIQKRSIINVHMASFLPAWTGILGWISLSFLPCLSVLRPPTHSLPSGFRGWISLWQTLPVLTNTSISPSSGPREVHHSNMTHCGQWNISKNGMCHFQAGAFQNWIMVFPWSLLLPRWTLEHSELEERCYKVKAAKNGGHRRQLPAETWRWL